MGINSNHDLFNTLSKTEQARILNAIAIMNSNDDNGKYGKLFELWTATETTSRKKQVARQNKVDLYIKIDGKRYTCECATNGHKFYDKDINKTDFVIYFLNVCNSTTKNKRVMIEPRIIPSQDFWHTILTYNLYKETSKNGASYGKNIQPSSRYLWEYLKEQPIYKENGISFIEWLEYIKSFI